jgi:hypothetical protein
MNEICGSKLTTKRFFRPGHERRANSDDWQDRTGPRLGGALWSIKGVATNNVTKYLLIAGKA